PKSFGSHSPNIASPLQPMFDAIELGIPVGAANPPKVQVFGVEHAQRIVRTAPRTNPVVIAGDGEGLVDAAAAGVIDGRTLVLSSAWFAKHPAKLQSLLTHDADLVVTDTNRRRVRHWGAVRDETGYTEQAGEQALVHDPSDKRLNPFPDAGDDARTVAIHRGVRSVQATTYGDPPLLPPEDPPAKGVDGDLGTAWIEGAGTDATGQRLVLHLAHPVTADHVVLVQPQTGIRDRYVTDVTLRFDGGHDEHVQLGPPSRAATGQRV